MHIFIKVDWRFLFIHHMPQSDLFIQQSARTVHLGKFSSAQKYIVIKRSWNNYENINVSLTLYNAIKVKWYYLYFIMWQYTHLCFFGWAPMHIVSSAENMRPGDYYSCVFKAWAFSLDAANRIITLPSLPHTKIYLTNDAKRNIQYSWVNIIIMSHY